MDDKNTVAMLCERLKDTANPPNKDEREFIFNSLQVLLITKVVTASEMLAKSAVKMERQTNRLIYLTWALVILTFVLLFFTVKLD